MEPTENRVILNINPKIFDELSFVVSGFSHSRKPGYVAYLCLLLLFYSYLYVTSIYNVTLLTHEIIYLIAGIHFFTATQWIFLTFGLRLMTHSSIKKTTEMITYGIYHYEHEEVDMEHERIKKEVADDWRRGMRLYVVVYSISFSMIMFVSPVLGYIVIDEDSPFYSDPVVNPYMPHVFYSPVNPNTIPGFVFTYLVDLSFWVVACFTSYTAIRMLLFVFIHLKLHLRVLNYSLSNIQVRATRMYSRVYGGRPEGMSQDELFGKEEFQKCLHWCLKANIRHHQTLLKYKHVFQPFCGPTLLAGFSAVVVIIYAALLYLVFQPLPISMRLKYFCMLISEEAVILIVCLFGEDIITESSKLFEVLYGTPWMDYDRNFKQTLHIMMTYTRVPLRYDALFLDSSASRETYGEAVKATYSLMNLVSNMV